MRKFSPVFFGFSLLVLAACSDSRPNPVESTKIKPASIICPPGSGIVIRTGADGQPYETCEPYAIRQQ
jgi:hypothetical protein